MGLYVYLWCNLLENGLETYYTGLMLLLKLILGMIMALWLLFNGLLLLEDGGF